MAAYGGGRGPGFGFSICKKGEQDLGIYLGPSKSETFNESMSYKKICLWGKMSSSGWEGKGLPREFIIICVTPQANSNDLQV